MAEFKLVKISDIAQTNTSSYSSKNNWAFVNYLDTGNITQNVIESIQHIDLTEEKLPSRAKRKVKTNSIIYSTVRPNQLHYGIVKSQPQNFLVSTGFTVIDVDETKAVAEYVYYFLTQADIVESLQAIGEQSVSTYPSIKPSDIENIEIPLPSLDVQKKIVGILKSLDDKIASNSAINNNLYEMVNAYYTSLFKDVECEMTTIGNYAERIYSGGTPTTSNATYWDGAFGWFSSGETRNRFVISTEKTITQAGIDNSSTKLAEKHDIVMASAGQGFTRGQTSMLLIDTYVNQSVIVIHADRNVLPYLFWNLANRYEELRAISDSSSIRGSLTTKMIATFEIPLATEDSLQAFADFSWSVIPQIENNLLENESLAALRDTLLPKLMSGEVDVSSIQI